MAPELFSAGIKKTRESDVYAFGMTILEIFTGRAPFQQYHHEMGVVMAISRGERPERPAASCMMCDKVWELVTKCWESDTKARPRMTVIAKRLNTSIVTRAMDCGSDDSLF